MNIHLCFIGKTVISWFRETSFGVKMLSAIVIDRFYIKVGNVWALFEK